MNIFYEYEVIFGKAETAHLDRALQEFFELAVTIRRKLGKQGYMLDKYLHHVLEAINFIGLRDSTDTGLDSASELRQLCDDVIGGKTDRHEHGTISNRLALGSGSPFPCFLAVKALKCRCVTEW